MNVRPEGDELVPMIELLLDGFSDRARINALSAALGQAIAASCRRDGCSCLQAISAAATVGKSVVDDIAATWDRPVVRGVVRGRQ